MSRRFPSSCTSRSARRPSPVATSNRSPAAAKTVPGIAFAAATSGVARWIFIDRPASLVYAPGQGEKARTDRAISAAPRRQSIAPSSFRTIGASVASRSFCSRCTTSPRVSASSVSTSRRAPTADSRAPSVSDSIVFVNRHDFLEEDIARIHPFVHLHDGDPGLRIAGEDRTLNRSGPAVSREERGVNVDRAADRHVQERLRKNLAVGGHDDRFGVERAQAFDDGGIAKLFRLLDHEPTLERQFLDGGGSRNLSSTRGAIGLREHRDHSMPVLENGAQRRRRERRRAHENEFHGRCDAERIRCATPGSSPPLLRAGLRGSPS